MGVVRQASYDVSLAALNNFTFETLQEKQFLPNKLCRPTFQEDSHPIPSLFDKDIIMTIHSFPNSSAGGPRWPYTSAAEGCGRFLCCCNCHQVPLPALTAFVELVLDCRMPSSILPNFFGANLTALRSQAIL